MNRARKPAAAANWWVLAAAGIVAPLPPWRHRVHKDTPRPKGHCCRVVGVHCGRDPLLEHQLGGYGKRCAYSGTPVVSADLRLRKEKWAIDGRCDSPIRTRVTDRYLGFTCSKGIDAAATCRLQPPAFDSKAFGRGRFQHCFDADVTSTEMEFVVNRVLEWVTAKPGKCEWDPDVNLLSVEMDLDNARVCIEDQCISITKLSVVGRLRVVRTILKAFNQPSQ